MTYCEGRFGHSLTHSGAIRFVTAGKAVWAPFKFSGFPWAKHTFGFIFSRENLTDFGQISLC